MRLKRVDVAIILSLVLIVSSSMIVLLPKPVKASYSLSLSGNPDFPEVAPFTSVEYKEWVTIFLEDDSEGPLDIRLTASGDLAPYTTFGTDNADYLAKHCLGSVPALQVSCEN